MLASIEELFWRDRRRSTGNSLKYVLLFQLVILLLVLKKGRRGFCTSRGDVCAKRSSWLECVGPITEIGEKRHTKALDLLVGGLASDFELFEANIVVSKVNLLKGRKRLHIPRSR